MQLNGTIGNMGGGLLQSLCNSGVSTVLQGGKIVFPEIWQDSTYDRSYSLDIKLRSPDHDSSIKRATEWHIAFT